MATKIEQYATGLQGEFKQAIKGLIQKYGPGLDNLHPKDEAFVNRSFQNRLLSWDSHGELRIEEERLEEVTLETAEMIID